MPVRPELEQIGIMKKEFIHPHRTFERDLHLVLGARLSHQAVSLKVAASLLRHAESENLGYVLQAPCNVVLSRDCVIQPDIIFIMKGRSGLLGRTGFLGAPDLIIEVLSPETRERDLRVKRNIYSRFEVKEYWTVDPDAETVEVLLWSELGYASQGIYGKADHLSSPTLPKLRLQLYKVLA